MFVDMDNVNFQQKNIFGNDLFRAILLNWFSKLSKKLLGLDNQSC